MDKKQIAHEIALTSAKTFCDSAPIESNVKNYASNMAKNYLEAYASAKAVLDEAESTAEHVRVLK